MRLIKLTIQAFGPFKDKVEIDFKNNNLDHGLLLITGDTGSGKTTIFDAICFALYGEASGNNRKIDSFRSDFANHDLETYVELEFSHNNKYYKIKRTPRYLRKKARGEGFTEALPTAEFEINNRVITKPTEATSEIINLLGLDAKQFKQYLCYLKENLQSFYLQPAMKKPPFLERYLIQISILLSCIN